MDWPIRIVRYVVAFIAAVIVTYLLASWFYTELVLGELGTVGVDIPIGVHFTNTWENFVGLSDSAFGSFWGTYPGVILVGLALGFGVAFYMKLHTKPLYSAIGAAIVGALVAIAANQIFGQSMLVALGLGAVAIPVAFGFNWLVTNQLQFLERLAYPIAGAAVVGMVLYAIGWALGAASMAGAREPAGFVLQMVAGLIGGIVFAVLRPADTPDIALPAAAAPAAPPAAP